MRAADDGVSVTINNDLETTTYSHPLKKFDKYVLNPLSLTARMGAGPWMMYVNAEAGGVPAVWGPAMMTILNTLAFLSDVMPASKKHIIDRLKGQVIPAVAIATVFLMLGQQSVADKKEPLVLGALFAFVLPAFAHFSAGEELKEKFGMAYFLMSKALVLVAMVGFFMATNLNAVLLLLGDEVLQTGRVLAPTVKKNVKAFAGNVHATFSSSDDAVLKPGNEASLLLQ